MQSFLDNEFNGVGTEFYKNGNKQGFYYYEKGQRKIAVLWYENASISSIIEGEQHNGDYFKTTEYDTLGNIINIAYRLNSNALHDITYYPCLIKKMKQLIMTGHNFILLIIKTGIY